MSIYKGDPVLGNQPLWAIKSMVRALSLMQGLNTKEENKRLEYAKKYLTIHMNKGKK